MDFFFMFIGLGFFLFIIWFVVQQHDKEYNRKLNEQREFGYRTIPRSQPRSRFRRK